MTLFASFSIREYPPPPPRLFSYTSLNPYDGEQVVLNVIPQASGQLPVVRYKVRVEEAQGNDNRASATVTPEESDAVKSARLDCATPVYRVQLKGNNARRSELPSSVPASNNGVERTGESRSDRAARAHEGAARMKSTDLPLPRSTSVTKSKGYGLRGLKDVVISGIADLILIQAGGSEVAKGPVAMAGEERSRKVAVPGLKPSTLYRVQVSGRYGERFNEGVK